MFKIVLNLIDFCPEDLRFQDAVTVCKILPKFSDFTKITCKTTDFQFYFSAHFVRETAEGVGFQISVFLCFRFLYSFVYLKL